MAPTTNDDIEAARKVLRADIVDAVLIAQREADDPFATEMQTAIERGMWGMDGSFGRAMMDAIEWGACMLGSKATRDYWGNSIPGRYDVAPGTKGSPEYALSYWGGRE